MLKRIHYLTMQRRLLCLISLFTALLAHSESSPSMFYQIDIIGFIHQPDQSYAKEASEAPLMINFQKTISLQPDYTMDFKPYHLRSLQTSRLGNESYMLRKKPQYQVIFHYTWIQPSNNQRAVQLPSIDRNGWQVEGSLRIRKSNYYLLDSELYFTPTDTNNKQSFVFSQKQRLKNNTVYYLDHPLAGMLIKVHKLS